jgi:hypothetical protein
MTLAGLCFVAPEIEQRLRQVGPNKGRAGAGQVQGSSQVFALAEGLPDGVKKVSSSPGNVQGLAVALNPDPRRHSNPI